MSKKNTVTYELHLDKALEFTPRQQADLDALDALSDDQIDTSDIPEVTEDFWRNAIRNAFYRPTKSQLTVRIDADILAWLRGSGSGYQTRLNGILRDAMLRDLDKRLPADAVARPKTKSKTA